MYNFSKFSVLRTDGIEKIFNQAGRLIEVLRGISISFVQDKSYSIMGVSGTGKSTLMHILAGMELPSKGKVLFNDLNLNDFDQKNKELFLNESIGFVFQESYLIKELNVLENIMLKKLIKNESFIETKEKALDLMKKVGLIEKANCLPSTLSGGEQQRVAILRAILNKPKFLLADEPTGNLDEETAKEVINLLLDYKNEWGMGLIISTHDKKFASMTDKILELKNGQLIEM